MLSKLNDLGSLSASIYVPSSKETSRGVPRVPSILFLSLCVMCPIILPQVYLQGPKWVVTFLY